jgi:hypothetical protein
VEGRQAALSIGRSRTLNTPLPQVMFP